MSRAALHDGTQAQFTVLLGASHAVELPFHEELTALAATEARLNYQATISQPGAAGDRPWHGRTGRVDGLAADIAATIDPAGGHVYAVGNKGMIASVRDHVGRAGLRISTESYGGSARLAGRQPRSVCRGNWRSRTSWRNWRTP